jgi:hypothetical protein
MRPRDFDLALDAAVARRIALALTTLALALMLGARTAHSDDKASVATPFGSISAKAKGAPEFVAGMPEYPGAHRTKGDPDGDGAQVTLKLPVISMKMQALRYETDRSVDEVAAFYHVQLAKLGKLNESDEGPHTDMGDFHWTPGPGQHTIAAQGENRVYMATMKRHGSGCQFALVGIKFEE